MNPDRGVYDPLGPAAEEAYRETANYSKDGETSDQRKYLKFYSPSELLAYQEPEGHNLIGDYHIQRGATTVFTGAPDVGKSRAALWLTIAGASGEGAWFGLPVHCQFRTLMLNNENGLVRLHHDFKQITLPDGIDSWLRVSSPPPFGMLMDDPRFRAELCAIVKDFNPHLLTIGSWNSVTRDVMERDYHQAFVWLREVLADCPENPACLIVHHTRKPRAEDRAKGRGLINLMAGSYTIFSVPRCAMILQRASDSFQDNHVVFSVLKNNDGTELGKRSAWELRDGGFFEDKEFDWENFDSGGAGKPRPPIVTEEHLRVVFDNGETWLKRKEAEEKLEMIAGVSRTTAYEALKTYDGRFSEILRRRNDGKIGLVENELL
jgi:AAA domain